MSYECDDVRQLVLRVMKAQQVEATLRCLSCGDVRLVGTANIDAQLIAGWPRCCGKDISLISVRYPREERASA